MSDTSGTATSTATAPATEPVVAPPDAATATPPPAVAPAPTATATPPAEPTEPVVQPQDPAFPAWLRERLAKKELAGKSAVFSKVGVKDEAELLALVQSARAADEAKKTDLQRAQERIAALEAQAARATTYGEVIQARATAELAALTDAQRNAVIALGGEDPARLLSAIDTLKPTWVSAPTSVPATTTPKPLPAPASTTAATPPPQPKVTQAVNHLEVWERLKDSDPARAALYLDKNERAIYAQIEARRTSRK